MITEDGSGVPDADTYVDIETFRMFAASRGITLPDDDNAAAVFLVKAMDYLEAQSNFYIGVPTYAMQELSWPRTGAIINREVYPSDKIPSQLKRAQMLLAIDAFNGIVLMPSVGVPTEPAVTKEKVGPLEIEYADPVDISGSTPVLGAASAYLSLLFATPTVNFAVVRK